MLSDAPTLTVRNARDFTDQASYPWLARMGASGRCVSLDWELRANAVWRLRRAFPGPPLRGLMLKPAPEAPAPMQSSARRYHAHVELELRGWLLDGISDPLYQAGRFVSGSALFRVAVESL
jgi:hypothetical protein